MPNIMNVFDKTLHLEYVSVQKPRQYINNTRRLPNAVSLNTSGDKAGLGEEPACLLSCRE